MGTKNGKPIRPSKVSYGPSTHRFKATSVTPDSSVPPPQSSSSSSINNSTKNSLFSRISSRASSRPVSPNKVAPPPPLKLNRLSNVSADQVPPPPALKKQNSSSSIAADQVSPPPPLRFSNNNNTPQPQFNPQSSAGPVRANSVPGY